MKKKEEIPKLTLTEEEITEDFTAMLHAMYVTYIRVTEEDEDIIGFIHVLNRLAIQHIMDSKEQL